MAMGGTISVSCDAVFDGATWMRDACLLLEDGVVRSVEASHDGGPAQETISLTGGVIAPAFVDLQVNGGGGVLLNNGPSAEAISAMADAHEGAGTSAILPTVISDDPALYPRVAEAAKQAWAKDRRILGLHIEGPHFSMEKRGVHAQSAIRTMSAEESEFLCALAGELPLLVTLAPEATSPDMVAKLAAAGVCVSIGHTNADYETVNDAFDAGASMATHLYNAMSPFTPRAPGAVGACLDRDEASCGIIADSFHVSPAAIRLAAARKPEGKLFLVSDAMATAGSDVAEFRLYGETITVKDGMLVNGEGKLAGSNATLSDCVRYCVNTVGLPLIDVLKMASLYPASLIGAEGCGRLTPGGAADAVFVGIEQDKDGSDRITEITPLSRLIAQHQARS